MLCHIFSHCKSDKYQIDVLFMTFCHNDNMDLRANVYFERKGLLTKFCCFDEQNYLLSDLFEILTFI